MLDRRASSHSFQAPFDMQIQMPLLPESAVIFNSVIAGLPPSTGEISYSAIAQGRTNIKQNPVSYLFAAGKARLYHAFPLNGNISTKELRDKIGDHTSSLSPVIKMLTDKGLIIVVDRVRGRSDGCRAANVYRRTLTMPRALLEKAYPEKSAEEIDALLEQEHFYEQQ